ncbi:hypothetical protein JAAARDRAFT_387589 [Jaapia argillacea MUCL 33604]|uniref:F-box domain-containing protein n=1 Tax=Jaapia argillacea MUCL 33604 TaxID=933084 RepID=A0A067QM23_9AGAM|nr:hypothetical protein JAAARDRAFT_387589 [Jaapia argillacea MUCL 33604]
MCTTLSNLLPVELCAHIFEFATSPGDLYNICLASRTFACEAQRLLFRSVAIDTHNRRRSFAQSVIAHPSLGRWVHSLAIELVERDDDAHQAFLSLVNLRHLRVSGYTGHSAAFPSSQFLGCPYRLLSFHNYSFNLEGTVKFLLNQPDITNWTHQQSEFYANGEEGVKFSNDFLPNVNSMEVDAEVLAAFSSSRPVTSMKVRFWHLDEEEETRALRDIALFRDTLTTLSLQHWDSNPHVSLTNTVTMLTQGAPNLRRLCLAGFYRNDDWGSVSYRHLVVS